jgi:ribonuclease HII
METPGVYYSVAEISAEEIDASDILRATWKAMAKALSGIIPPAEFALVDGNPVKGLPLPSQNIVKGDAKSASIAAASILAKTHRDLVMMEAAKKWQEYQFDVHKGYCTKLHTSLIEKYGPCPIHRKTFEPVRSILNPPDMIQGELF